MENAIFRPIKYEFENKLNDIFKEIYTEKYAPNIYQNYFEISKDEEMVRYVDTNKYAGLYFSVFHLANSEMDSFEEYKSYVREHVKDIQILDSSSEFEQFERIAGEYDIEDYYSFLERYCSNNEASIDKYMEIMLSKILFDKAIYRYIKKHWKEMDEVDMVFLDYSQPLEQLLDGGPLMRLDFNRFCAGYLDGELRNYQHFQTMEDLILYEEEIFLNSLEERYRVER